MAVTASTPSPPMNCSSLLLALVPFQDPAPDAQAAPPAPARFDVVELPGGERLEGRIVLERGNYFQIELEPGSVVGFRTTDVGAVLRGAGREIPVRAAPILP